MIQLCGVIRKVQPSLAFGAW